MLPAMPILDTRTDVLKALVSKAIKPTDLPVVTRELSNVLIGISADFFEISRLLKGDNGTGGGLQQQVQDVQRDVTILLNKVNALAAPAPVSGDADKRNGKDLLLVFLKWFADKVLPTLVVTAILAFIAFQVAVSNHIHLVQMTP